MDSSSATSEMSEYEKPHADLSAWGKSFQSQPTTSEMLNRAGTSRAMSCFAAIREGHKTKKAAGLCSLPEGGGYLLSHFRSTIGVAGFNFSVRNGKRWNPRAITTLIFFVTGTHFWRSTAYKVGKNRLLSEPTIGSGTLAALLCVVSSFDFFGRTCPQERVREISNARLRPSLTLDLRPIYVVVCNVPNVEILSWGGLRA